MLISVPGFSSDPPRHREYREDGDNREDTPIDLCHLQHKLIGFYNRDEKCLQRGTDWVFKYSGLRLVCKGLIFMCFVFI